MSFPSYFQQLPNIDYSAGVNKAGIQKRISIKDYFHLLRVKDDVFKYNTNYYTYTVVNGERPEQVAFKEYGDEQYYWIVLQTNDIVDPYFEWPMSDHEFEEYIVRKYGSTANADQVKHYITREVVNDYGQVLQNAGHIVFENYEFTYQPDPNEFNYKVSRPAPVTFYQWERGLNDEKAKITLLNKRYVLQMDEEFRTFGRTVEQANIHSNIDIAEYYQ